MSKHEKTPAERRQEYLDSLSEEDRKTVEANEKFGHFSDLIRTHLSPGFIPKCLPVRRASPPFYDGRVAPAIEAFKEIPLRPGRGPGNVIQDKCNRCDGSGKDPKKRKRSCPLCEGRGWREYCGVCGEVMRCGGRDPDGLDGFMGDPPLCERKGRGDQRTYAEIKAE